MSGGSHTQKKTMYVELDVPMLSKTSARPTRRADVIFHHFGLMSLLACHFMTNPRSIRRTAEKFSGKKTFLAQIENQI